MGARKALEFKQQKCIDLQTKSLKVFYIVAIRQAHSSLPWQLWLSCTVSDISTIQHKTNAKSICNALISPSRKTGIGGARGDCYWEWSAYSMEKSSRLRLRLKLFTQVAERQLKDRSFQIFGALTENALLAMTRDIIYNFIYNYILWFIIYSYNFISQDLKSHVTEHNA